MQFLSDQDKRRIREAIQAAEARSHGELVTVIAQAADEYRYIPSLWALLLAFLASPLGRLLGLQLSAAHWDLVQLAAFAILAALFLLTPLKYRMIPKAVKAQRSSRLAHEQFIRQGVHLTARHTGILLFVSVAEHHVEIIADRGISERVPAEHWQQIIDAFTARVRQGRVADGFVGAVEALGALLAEHQDLLAPEDNRNELPDHLIELLPG